MEEKLDIPTTAKIVDNFMVDLYANKPIPNISKDLWKKITFLYNSYLNYFYSKNSFGLSSLFCKSIAKTNGHY